MLMYNQTEDVDFLTNLSKITFDGEFGPVEIFDWQGVWRAIWITLLASSALVTFIVNIIPIHFITIQPSPRRPIDILLLYDQVRKALTLLIPRYFLMLVYRVCVKNHTPLKINFAFTKPRSFFMG